MSHFYTLWKRQKTTGFLTFSGGIEMWHWSKMGEKGGLQWIKVFMIRFYFVSALPCLVIIMNIQWSKQPIYNWSCLWNLHFLVIFGNFELIYLWISRPNISMNGDEEDIFSKAPDWKPFFLLKIKIGQNPGCPHKEHNAIFENMHQNMGAYPRCKKKSVLINDWEKIFAYWKESDQSKV